MPSPKEVSFQIPTGQVAGLAWGDPAAPRILAAHGWLDNAASFNHLLPLMKDYYILAIDLPGHGFSSHRPAGSYFHFIDYIPDLIMLLDVLEWEQCTLMGHSLGAGIFSILAGVIPERVNTLALIDALAPFSAPPEEMPGRILTATRQYQKIYQRQPPSYQSFEEAVEARFKVSDMLISSVETLVRRGLKKEANGYRWRNDPKLLMRSMIMFTESQIEAYLSKITAPTCLIRPSEGWPVDDALFKSRIAKVKSIDVHELPGHHHLHLDAPQAVAEKFNEFLRNNA